MKLCVDCRHFSTINKHCEAPQNVERGSAAALALVGAGRAEPSLYAAQSHRSCGWLQARTLNACGKEGRWFQPKEAK